MLFLWHFKAHAQPLFTFEVLKQKSQLLHLHVPLLFTCHFFGPSQLKMLHMTIHKDIGGIHTDSFHRRVQNFLTSCNNYGNIPIDWYLFIVSKRCIDTLHITYFYWVVMWWKLPNLSLFYQSELCKACWMTCLHYKFRFLKDIEAGEYPADIEVE